MQAYWVIIPGAGIGSRFNEDAPPKQYRMINGKTVLEHTLRLFLNDKRIEKIIILLSQTDSHFSTLSIAQHPKIVTLKGGETRMGSVQNALEWLKTVAHSPQDWVIVHDAVRPALHKDDLNNLIETVGDDEIGGILVSPVQDTLKFGIDAKRISHTVSRSSLWRALTPQLFRLNILSEGLSRAKQIGLVATDEAHMVEQLGHQPKMVMSIHPNPKLTYPQDIHFLSHLLEGVG